VILCAIVAMLDFYIATLTSRTVRLAAHSKTGHPIDYQQKLCDDMRMSAEGGVRFVNVAELEWGK
jgi:hypothetical protein